MHRPCLGDPGNVIAQEIHDHEVLCPVLFILTQKVTTTGIFPRVRAAGLGSLHGPRFNGPIRVGAKEQLWRARQKIGQPVLLDQHAVANRLPVLQRAIKLLSAAIGLCINRKGQVGLIDVTLADIAVHLGEGLCVAFKSPARCDAFQTCFVFRLRMRAARRARNGRRFINTKADQRQASLLRHQRRQLWFQRIAQFIRRIARKPVPCPTRSIQRGEGCRHLTCVVGADNARRLVKTCPGPQRPLVKANPHRWLLRFRPAPIYSRTLCEQKGGMRHFQFRFRSLLNLSSRSL